MRLFLLSSLSIILSFQSISQGNCNETDLDYLAENLDIIAELSTDCSNQCLAAPDLEACVEQCVLDNTPLSVSCAGCFGEQVTCALDNCLLTCFIGTEQECADCVTSNCLDDFNECAGIIDLDNDNFTTLFDCDDTNPNIYPDAPGTGENIDNNCDGEITGTELSAPCGDLDQNGVVTVADLSFLLGDFGCISSDCQADVDNSGGTTAADLTIILSSFGQDCN